MGVKKKYFLVNLILLVPLVVFTSISLILLIFDGRSIEMNVIFYMADIVCVSMSFLLLLDNVLKHDTFEFNIFFGMIVVMILSLLVATWQQRTFSLIMDAVILANIIIVLIHYMKGIKSAGTEEEVWQEPREYEFVTN